MKNIPEELKEIAPHWHTYLTRAADFTKLKTRPNENIDMNDFRFCVVGESHGDKLLQKYSPANENYCTICFKSSYKISEEYHTLILNNGDTLPKFNKTLQEFIKHFKSEHQNKK